MLNLDGHDMTKADVLEAVTEALRSTGQDTFDGILFMSSSPNGAIGVVHNIQITSLATLLLAMKAYDGLLSSTSMHLLLEALQ